MDTLERFAAGDADAFETLFRQHQSEVYRWIDRLVRNPGVAEELTVETSGGQPEQAATRVPAQAFGEVFGKETVFIRSGGSIPIVGDFETHLGIPTMLMGFGLPDDGLHHYEGILPVAHFLEECPRDQPSGLPPRRRMAKTAISNAPVAQVPATR